MMRARPPGPTIRRGAIGLAAIAIVMTIADLIVITLPRATPAPDVYGFPGAAAVFAPVFAIVGAAIAVRRPQNSVGWIFLVSAVAIGVLELGADYSAYAIVERGRALPAGDWAAWISGWSLTFAVGTISSYLLLVFPDGRLPSSRWRPVAWFTLFSLGLWAVITAVSPGPIRGAAYASNPLWPASARLSPELARLLDPGFPLVVLPTTVVLCAAALAHRFRRARGVERQQLKWMAYAAAIVAVGVALLPATPGFKALQIAQMATVLAVPIAAGVAILRHRLYDIDLLIKRTVVYGSLSAVLIAMYVGAVIATEAVLRPLTAGSELSVAASTLLVVALFQPVRRRIQGIVDRRFNRGGYDAARAIDTFSVRLRDEVALDVVRMDFLDAVGQTVQPVTASLWLRPSRNDSRTAGE